MHYMKRITFNLILFFVLVLTFNLVHANPQDLSVSAVELALVGANYTRSNDAFRFQNNPATIVFKKGFDAGFTSCELYDVGLQHQFVTATISNNKVAAGLGLEKLTDPDPIFLYSDSNTYISLGAKVTKNIGLGANLKQRKFSLAEGRTGSGWYLDVGLLSAIGSNSFAVCIHNLYSKMEYASGYVEEEEPKIALALEREILNSSCEFVLEDWKELKVGIEMHLSPAVTFRLGLSPSKIGAGFGFDVMKIKANYGIQLNDLGILQQISMGLNF